MSRSLPHLTLTTSPSSLSPSSLSDSLTNTHKIFDLSVQAPGLLARHLLEWAAAFRDQPIVLSDVEAYEAAHGNPSDWNLKEVSEGLGPFSTKFAEVALESSSKQC